MQFRSTKALGPQVSFKDAVLRCLPVDGGLYVPSTVPDMRQFFLYMDEKTTYPELIAAVAPSLLQGELNPFSASRVAESAFDFEPDLKQLDDNFSILSLYNGPTGVFKDFGVAFLAAVLEELTKNSGNVMVISAARGITGISIAKAFQGRQGLTAVLLYPAGTIRGLDPATFVPNGGNIIPIQVRGTYDDCQALIAELINDRPFAERYQVTSANTINPGRLLPQAFYYLYAFIKAKKYLSGDLVFSVPSGNFGNLISGLYAWKFGMPVNGFIAAMNANNIFGDFMRGGKYTPHPLVTTNSPALDISQPSNYERLASFYEESPAVMRNMVFPAAIDDETTIKTIKEAWTQYGILLNPHSAVAFAAAKGFAKDRDYGTHAIVLATGHPAREAELVEKATGQTAGLPEKLHILNKRSEPIALIDPELDSLESAIASCL
ncbi:threonine synthase [Leadbettera azotonutricia]|uniref:Threonine synthase n=1 Tax=Leadbettera azotonutricia (strain ATCC BAA-888 / DSM 13862 / ZAS-9) TaxID=545695 RepID=F5YF34_LEAAZ|nr:threonine synthase [Leadbettera azotonutricia]AEF82008.1 threonine synthase [Leadbettera azotonutricia ZAS-9]